MDVQLVWFKKDLRVRDHRPLAEAARRGPCVGLFVYEPEGLAAPEWDGSHWRFLNESLEELGAAIAALGGVLLLRHGPMPAVLDTLHQELGIAALWSHQETGSDWTYARDRRVGRWARAAGVPWHELRQGGVVRRLSTRDVWAAQWQAFMAREILAAPARLEAPAGLDAGRIWRPEDLGLDLPAKPAAQPGGEAAAREALRSFLRERGKGYRSAMSSPLLAELACSRLSPHLAFGTLSGRTAYQAAGRRAGRAGEALATGEPGARKWQQAMESFQSRLAWRCHFTQKLEDEPEIEFRNMCRSFDGLREDAFDEARFEAWCRGETGFPMIDACMRALLSTGWINFRMRAMLISFATYHLWLHWRRPAIFLARHFLDFEPGIHFPQIQMQSGVTGINTMRVYSPTKQAREQDPTGAFIRRYVPELAGLPDDYLHEPSACPPLLQLASGCVVGVHYPAPIVEEKAAAAAAKARVYAVRQDPGTIAEAQRVYLKHGSRKRHAE
jgi:deoxyribodipyrimidine photo-lyase